MCEGWRSHTIQVYVIHSWQTDFNLPVYIGSNARRSFNLYYSLPIWTWALLSFLWA